jgi:hypothetical protein
VFIALSEGGWNATGSNQQLAGRGLIVIEIKVLKSDVPFNKLVSTSSTTATTAGAYPI